METDVFFERLDTLTKGERTALKRSCGVMLQQADGVAIAAFYKCLPYSVPRNAEGKWFAAASIHCLWENETREPFERAIGKMKVESNTVEGRVIVLSDMSWDDDGLFLSKLVRLIKMAKQKGFAIDANALLKDLIYWDSDSRNVQRRWLKEIIRYE